MRHHHSPGIRGQLMWFLCCICLFLLALVWFLSTQLLEPLYTKHIEKQLTTQAESITAELDKAIANGEALSAWSFGHLTVNTAFFDRLATQLYASGSLNSFCVDISDTTMRTIYKIENQSYCNLHETLLSDSANNDMIVSTAVAMRKKCRTTGGFVQTLNPPRLSGSAQLLVGRNTAGGEYTVLADLITKALGKKPWDSLANIYAGGRSYIASFAHTVFEGMEMGDAVCRRIVEESAYKLSELTFAAEKYFPGEFPVVMSGGIFRAYPKYVQLVCAKASPKARMILAVVPPVYGALVEAMWQNGRTADAAVQRNFMGSIQRLESRVN